MATKVSAMSWLQEHYFIRIIIFVGITVTDVGNFLVKNRIFKAQPNFPGYELYSRI
jgi:hypothetical protein